MDDLSKPLTGSISFVIIGLILLAVGLYFYFKDSAVLSQWQSEKAQVTKSSLKQFQRVSGRSPSYTADMEYEYQVAGKKYRGSCCGYGSGDYDRWKSVVDKNPVGSSADILVNPNDPSNSMLKDSIQPFNWLNTGALIAGAIITIIGIISTYLTLTGK